MARLWGGESVDYLQKGLSSARSARKSWDLVWMCSRPGRNSALALLPWKYTPPPHAHDIRAIVAFLLLIDRSWVGGRTDVTGMRRT